MEKFNLTSGDNPINCSQQDFFCSITIPFQKCLASGSSCPQLFCPVGNIFSCDCCQSLTYFQKVCAYPFLAVEHEHSPFLASRSPNYPSAMRHVRMYSSWSCQASFQPALFNWSSLQRYMDGEQSTGKGFIFLVCMLHAEIVYSVCLQ